jgi:hypothetical protein
MVDKVMYQNNKACIVFAAGNDGDLTIVSDEGIQQQIGDFTAAKTASQLVRVIRADYLMRAICPMRHMGIYTTLME